MDQHGVFLVSSANEGVCEAVGGPGTPRMIDRVLIDSSLETQITRKTPGGTKKYPYADSTVAHELLHCCNVCHHGEIDYFVYWCAETVGDNPASIYEYQRLLDVASPSNGVRVNVLSESGGGYYDPTNPYWQSPVRIWMGDTHGQHSGFDDCVMRYDCSAAYAETGGGRKRYFIMGEDQEPVGLSICNSPKGTGVDVAGRRPQSRYGDANEGRGDCAGQICVNDLYHGEGF